MARKYNIKLDILRGAAASIVVFRHLISYGHDFDKRFAIDSIVHYNPPAHIAVLVFFILSGYVIGLNHPVLHDRREILDYVRKRLVRIVPIFFVVILATILILRPDTSFPMILSNLFFASVPMDNVLIEASPLWSLNYEIFYYLVFILFAYFNVNLVKTVIGLFGVAAILFAFFHNVRINPLLISYFVGFIFWITGAMIAKVTTWKDWDITSSRVISLFLLLFCLQYFNLYGPVLKLLHVPLADYSSYSWFQQSISWDDLFFYPLTVVMILSLTRSYSFICPAFIWFTFGAAFLRLAMLIKMYGLSYIAAEHYVIPSALLLISAALWVLNFNVGGVVKKAIVGTAPLSKISYALYMVHLPILFMFGTYWTSSGDLSFIMKTAIFLLTVAAVSYLLEIKFQGFVNKLFRKKKPTQEPQVLKP